MIKPYGPSQPPTPACGIQTLPAFCHKERFLSYKKRGKKRRGWCACRFLTTNPVPRLKLPTRSPCFAPGKGTCNSEKPGFSPIMGCKPHFDSEGRPREKPLGREGAEQALAAPLVRSRDRQGKGHGWNRQLRTGAPASPGTPTGEPGSQSLQTPVQAPGLPRIIPLQKSPREAGAEAKEAQDGNAAVILSAVMCKALAFLKLHSQVN